MSTWISRAFRPARAGLAADGSDWEALAARPPLPGPGLDGQRDRARALRGQLDRFLLVTDPAATRTRPELDRLELPRGTDWRWRPPMLAAPVSPAALVTPENGQAFGGELGLFHDCPLRAAILRQLPNRRAQDLAPFALRLEVFGFAGSYLSLAIPLPAAALDGLTRSHIIRAELQLDIERPLGMVARLNVENGPNTDRLPAPLEGLQPGPNRALAEFDLADTEMNENRLERAWIDLILDQPAMNAVTLRDMVVSRHPRAEI